MKNWIRRKLLELRIAWHEATLSRLIAEQTRARRQRDAALARLEELNRREQRTAARREIARIARQRAAELEAGPRVQAATRILAAPDAARATRALQLVKDDTQ